jgi:hypothetical protein
VKQLVGEQAEEIIHLLTTNECADDDGDQIKLAVGGPRDILRKLAKAWGEDNGQLLEEYSRMSQHLKHIKEAKKAEDDWQKAQKIITPMMGVTNTPSIHGTPPPTTPFSTSANFKQVKTFTATPSQKRGQKKNPLQKELKICKKKLREERKTRERKLEGVKILLAQLVQLIQDDAPQHS